MCTRLVNFFDKNKIFYDKQLGFRAKYSTDLAIISIIDKIQTAINANNYACGIFLDFSKGFDTVNHKILIQDSLSLYLWYAWDRDNFQIWQSLDRIANRDKKKKEKRKKKKKSNPNVDSWYHE